MLAGLAPFASTSQTALLFCDFESFGLVQLQSVPHGLQVNCNDLGLNLHE